MVDAGRLRVILERVDRDVRRLRDLSATPAEVLIDELNLLDAVKYRFVTAIEGLIDAAHHVIASQRLKAATTSLMPSSCWARLGCWTSRSRQRLPTSPASATCWFTATPRLMTSGS